MLEKFSEKIKKPKGELLDEDQYYQDCVEYALSTGWVKKKEKNILKDKYLKPIYQKYLGLIEEVKNEIKTENNPGTTIEDIIEKLNLIMERTRRIGSTDPGNITRSIGDFYKFSCREDTYTEYAAMALYQFMAEIIN